jgi:UDP-N-acetylglucosamine 4,6-dehydratase
MFKDKVLLVTGGTGSFGKTVLYSFLNSDIGQIKIFSRDEEKQDKLRNEIGNNNKVKFYVGDVRDYRSIYDALLGVDYVFHAAALKQVPSCEFFPMEAIKTNILGSENVINASIERKVKKLIALSTDKAVYPINAMGASKFLMEKFLIAKSRMLRSTDTILCGTRYGNVIASRGSVIPLFKEQIHNNKDLTVTDPDMTRFCMTLQDSLKLVLLAFEKGKQGDIFVQKAPAFKIDELANTLINYYKKKLQIKIIGTRHGEKLFETLVSREEMCRAVDHGNFFQIPIDDRGLDYQNYFDLGDKKITKLEDYTSHNATLLSPEEIINVLKAAGVLND